MAAREEDNGEDELPKPDPSTESEHDPDEEASNLTLNRVKWHHVDNDEKGVFSAKEKLIPVSSLKFDTELRYGQVRGLDNAHVQRILESFDVRPPDKLINVLLYDDGSMRVHVYARTPALSFLSHYRRILLGAFRPTHMQGPARSLCIVHRGGFETTLMDASRASRHCQSKREPGEKEINGWTTQRRISYRALINGVRSNGGIIARCTSAG